MGACIAGIMRNGCDAGRESMGGRGSGMGKGWDTGGSGGSALRASHSTALRA